MKSDDRGGASYPVSDLNQVRRRHDRGFYEHATVHALLDAISEKTFFQKV